jgi:hypothetical protein
VTGSSLRPGYYLQFMCYYAAIFQIRNTNLALAFNQINLKEKLIIIIVPFLVGV